MTIGREAAARVVLGVVLSLVAHQAPAQNAARGKQLYSTKLNPAYQSCSDSQCHGPDPLQNKSNIRKGTSASVILNALSSVPLMNPLRSYVSSADAADIAAYIANPAAATAPAVTASATTLSFGSTQVGTSNASPTPASVTLTNTGSGSLTISAVNKSGTNAVDFTPTGSCIGTPATVAPGASCTLSATFRPSATGTRTATLTLTSNATTAPAITLAGTGSAVALPSVSVVPASLTFATQTIGTSGASQTFTLTNSGSAALTVTQVAAAPSPEFSTTSNCVGTVNAGAACTISVTFVPSAAGTRTGTLTVTSNAASSPSVFPLTGTGVLSASPIATIQSNAVAFPITTVGVASSGLSTTLTNTGNATLQITAVAIGGADAADFRLAAGNTCVPGAVAAGASCLLEVTFAPQSAGAKTALVTVTHNATGGPIALTVTGMAATAATSGTGGTGSSGTSAALVPSNVGGGGALVAWQVVALALALLLAGGGRRRSETRGGRNSSSARDPGWRGT